MMLIGVDTGNGNLKSDTGLVMSAGIKKLATKPPIDMKTLYWDGQYYAVGTPKMEINNIGIVNEDVLVLTMAAIAEKFKEAGVTSDEIRLGVGLPLTWIGSEKKKLQNYYMSNRKLTFRYEGISYSVYIVSVDVFPQGYAAVVDRLSNFGMLTVVVDIGSWTVDVLPIVEGQPDLSRCKSLSLGTFTAIADVNENLRQKYGEEADAAILKNVMMNGTANIDKGYLETIKEGLSSYTEAIMNSLKTLKFNAALTEFVFIGGGASVIKHFGKVTENMAIIEDICINAKGYEALLRHKYRTVT